MDYVSIWLQNKQFLTEITDNDLFEIQSQIIAEIFGSFKSLLHCIMKQHHITTNNK